MKPGIFGAIILWTAIISGIILLAGCGGRAQDAAIGGLYGFGGASPPTNYIINGEYMSCRQIGNTTHCW